MTKIGERNLSKKPSGLSDWRTTAKHDLKSFPAVFSEGSILPVESLTNHGLSSSMSLLSP